MKTYKCAMVLILAVVIMGGIGVAQAEDFVFTVPVRLNNLHSQIASVSVRCQALSTLGAVVGGAGVFVAVGPTGNVSQDVIVKFNTQPAYVVSDATQYRCMFFLHGKGEESITIDPKNWTSIAHKPKPGTVFVQTVSGPIPKGGSAPMIVPKMPK